ncbi:hypothetical protein, partial [Mesorhizobium sp. M5C.F.Cr.IN.023.01.1.1]|uniref:hypothetical protein n=1 Tax=Mesorhizobium sp. M5C.F.Cr.IN.023.01.1.1 TaxID=2496768 RepID=UPI0019D04AF4
VQGPDGFVPVVRVLDGRTKAAEVFEHRHLHLPWSAPAAESYFLPAVRCRLNAPHMYLVDFTGTAVCFSLG